LINSTEGKLVYQPADADDHDAHYVAPRVYEVQKSDPLMDDEAKTKLFFSNFNNFLDFWPGLVCIAG
jgi:hypothetical protein